MIQKITKTLIGQLLVALLLGAIQVFAFAPFGQWWVLYPSFIGLFILLQQVAKTNRHFFLIGFAFNLAMFIATVHWIYVSMDLFGGMPTAVSRLLIFLLCAYLAIFPTLAIWASERLHFLSHTARYLLVFPVFWLLMDWFRGWFLTGFPWAYLGYSHADTPLVGFAPVLGVQGLTLAILIICAALTLIIQKQRIKSNLLLITLLIVGGHFLQQIRYTELQPAIKVALVQGNIDQNEKWKTSQLYPSLFTYLDLTEAGDNSDRENELIIWPESAVAALEIDMQRFLQPLSDELSMKGKTLLTGIIEYDVKSDDYHNAIIMLGKLPTGLAYSQTSPNRYRKHQLLPIGEFVPFEELLRPLAPYFNLPMSSFQRGAEQQDNLQSGLTSLAPALCYEIAFPELLRKNVKYDTGMLLTLSNDAWFGSSIGPDQHLEFARHVTCRIGIHTAASKGRPAALERILASVAEIQVQERLNEVQERIETAARRSGRDIDAIRIVGVTKTHSSDVVLAAHQAGLRLIGENRVEEALPKKAASEDLADLEWHMIGHIQSRKSKSVVQVFDAVHSVDRIKIADRLNRDAESAGIRLPILMECNVSGEASKWGWQLTEKESWPQIVDEFTRIQKLENLEVRGLMTMAPMVADPEHVRPIFEKLRLLRDYLQKAVPGDWAELSMGMTEDYAVAVEEGATLLRIGRAIFGPRATENG